MHTLRSSPCFASPRLDSIDDQFRQCVRSAFNVNLTDSQWSQACLPVRKGGLGIRSTAQLAPSAFLASIHSTLDLQQQLLGNLPMAAVPEIYIDEAKKVWCSYSKAAAPEGQNIASQRAWDDPIVDSSYKSL